MEQTVTAVILEMLAELGIDTIFTVPGGHNEDFLIAVCQDARFSLVIAAHEEGAGYMADGYARASGKGGVVSTINGPGTTNLLTAAVTAFKDRSPVLFLTGDVRRDLLEYGAFQASRFPQSDTHHIFQAAIGDSQYIESVTSLPLALHMFAKKVASLVRLPLHVNVPIDLWSATSEDWVPLADDSRELDSTDDSTFELLPAFLGHRALILVGEELYQDDHYEQVAAFSEQYAIPVAVTMAAKNITPFVRPDLYLGVFGYAGGPRSFAAMFNAQVETLLVFGATLGERNTVAWHPHFFQHGRKIIRFSLDRLTKRSAPSEVLHIEATIAQAITGMRARWPLHNPIHNDQLKDRQAWISELQYIPRIADVTPSLLGATVIALNRLLPENTQFFLDSGDHRIFGATYWEVRQSNTFFTSAKTAPMGWAIAAAVGASFVDKQRQICVLTGDGCMMMHGMELAVAARYRSRVLVVVCNNRSYGRIANRLVNHKLDHALASSISELALIDWTAWAQSLGVPAQRVEQLDQLAGAIERARTENGPYLLELMVDPLQTPPFAESVFSATKPREETD